MMAIKKIVTNIKSKINTMDFTTSLPPIPEGKPFENDKLDRANTAAVLTQIIQNAEIGFTMSLNARWGNGKTTFVKMWEAFLKNQGYRTIYLNAWEQDYLQDPFSVIISTIWDNLSAYSGNDIAEVGESMKKMVSVGCDIVKYYAGKAIGKETIDYIAEQINNAGKPEFLALCSVYPKFIKDFKKQLEEMVNRACVGKKLVVFVDELDRCRPNFAVEFLERIKHIFAIPNIVFVLSIDKDVLCSAIKGVYGSEQIDADRYLRRFIDIEYNLPIVSKKEFIELVYGKYQIGKYNCDTEMAFSGTDIHAALIDLLDKQNLCLRDIEKYIIKLQLATTALNNQNYNQFALALLLYLNMFYNQIYQQIKSLGYTYKKLLETLEDILCRDEEQTGIDKNAWLIISLYHVYKRHICGELIEHNGYNDIDVSTFHFDKIKYNRDRLKRDLESSLPYRVDMLQYMKVVEVLLPIQ